MTNLHKVLFFALTIFSSILTSAQGCLKLDIMVVVDVSSSIPTTRFPAIVNSVLAFANRFELSEEGIKLGIVKFSDGAQLMSPLTTDTNLLLMGIGGIQPTNGNTDMHAALDIAGNEFLTNGRKGYSKIVVLITDGDPTYKDRAFSSAELLKTGLGVKIFGIFVDNKNEIDVDLARMFSYQGTSGGNGGEKTLEALSSEGCYLKSNYETLLDEIEKLDICL